MNTNDFSKCEPGTKLWSIQLGECVFLGMESNGNLPVACRKNRYDGSTRYYTLDGKGSDTDSNQSLFFSNPNIVAPAKKEPLNFEYTIDFIDVDNITLQNMSISFIQRLKPFLGKKLKMTLVECET